MGIFSEDGINQGGFQGGSVKGGTFHGGVYREGRKLFMEGQPDLPALFERQSEFK